MDTLDTPVPIQRCKFGKGQRKRVQRHSTITSDSDHFRSDTTLNYANFAEGVKQWTNVFGYTTTPTSVVSNSPLPNWTRSIYGPNFQAISALGVDHNIPVQANDVLAWFGITGTSGSTTAPTSTVPTTSVPPTTTSSSGAAQWGQCGGCVTPEWSWQSC